MDAQIQNWDDLRYFLAVARAGSLSAAARDLGVNHSTVFRRIGALEHALGARLFERLPRGYALTAVGEEMLDIAVHIEDDVLTLDRQVLGRDRQLSGTVRVTTVEEVLALLAPDLARFRERYPGIEIEVDCEQRVLSLGRREADIAIRPGARPTEPDIVGRRLCSMRSLLYASRDYVDLHGAPTGIAELADHALISFTDEQRHIVTRSWLEQHVPGAPFAFRANTMLGQLAAVRAGIGIGVLPCFVADPIPELKRLLEPDATWGYGLWLLTHADLRQTARVRAFLDFVVAAIDRHRGLLEGE